MPNWLVKIFMNKQGSLRNGWKLLGFLCLYMGFSALLPLGWKLLPGPRVPPGIWTFAAGGALATYVCVRLEGRPSSSVGFLPGRRWLLECLAGTLGGILLILLAALVVRGLDGFHWQRVPGIGARQLLLSAWPLLGVAFREELLARGYPFQRLVEGAGPWVGQLVFAGVFALAHWGNPGMHGATKAWATLNIALAGLLLGFCYLRTRSLALPIGVHLGWNWAQGSLLGFGVSGTTDLRGFWIPVFHGKPEWLTGGAFGLEASLPCALVSAVAVFLLWRWKGSAADETTGGASTASAS